MPAVSWSFLLMLSYLGLSISMHYVFFCVHPILKYRPFVISDSAGLSERLHQPRSIDFTETKMESVTLQSTSSRFVYFPPSTIHPGYYKAVWISDVLDDNFNFNFPKTIEENVIFTERFEKFPHTWHQCSCLIYQMLQSSKLHPSNFGEYRWAHLWLIIRWAIQLCKDCQWYSGG